MSVSIDTSLSPLFAENTGNPNSWMISADANTANVVKFDDLAM